MFGKIIFYLFVIVAGAAIAYFVGYYFFGLGGEELVQTATEPENRMLYSFSERDRGDFGGPCDQGPTAWGFPITDLAIGMVTTLFGVIMHAIMRMFTE